MNHFLFEKSKLKGAYLIHSLYRTDERGCFIKDYNESVFLENKMVHNIKEVFYTISKPGVIRGMHFQNERKQAKLITCIHGHIYDVIVDLRKGSDTYGEWEAFDLTAEDGKCVYVPEDFAHGYLVLQQSVVCYKCNEIFYPDFDDGIRWDDERIGIEWPIGLVGGREKIILSGKDQSLQSFEAYDRKMKKDCCS